MTESELLNYLIRDLWPILRLWRTNVGSVRTADGRRFSTGLPKGFPDLFRIVPADKSRSGHAIPVFLECKTATGKPSPEQLAFLEAQRENGAVAGVVRSVADARKLLEPYIVEGLTDRECRE